MAEAEITIQYQTAPVFVLNKALAVLLPIGAVYIIWIAVVIVAAVGGAQVQLGPAMLILMAQILAYMLLVAATFLSGDKSVFLSRDGISLPFFVLPHRLPRTQLSWDNLVAVKFEPRKKSGLLKLQFRNVRCAVLDLRYLSADKVEEIVVALDVWSHGADRFPALMEARLHLGGHSGGASALSYTNMWEEELARRFGATNFIPLEPEHSLRNGDFLVERQLAFGGSSAIYLVRDRNKTKFVLKEAVVPENADADLRNKSIEMLRREAGYLHRLQHPALAQMLDYFVENERHYLLMDYVEGIDLRRLVREKTRPSVSDVCLFAKQIAEILLYLHSQNPPIVHRDLTPDNIILRDDGTIAVIDFGAANNFIGTATHTLIGKQSYMPPEQLRGKTEQRSDMYAFGATLHFLLTGNDPEPLAVSHPREDNTDVPQALDELVARCTQLELTDRPQHMDAILQELSQMQSHAA